MDGRVETKAPEPEALRAPPEPAAPLGHGHGGREGHDATVARPNRKAAHERPRRFARLLGGATRLATTLLIFAAAVVAALLTWQYYVSAPWTRDGRIRVQVASVAPQVSGQITEVRIVDNQFVRKGDVLFVIDPFDFRTALRTAKAQVQQKAADLQVKRVQAERRQRLSDLATTPEEQQVYVGNATQAQATFEAAQAQEAQAEINLRRTRVTSPVSGFITNLLMRVGDYAREGSSSVSVIDADSFWIDGYFEETKMAHVCIGDAAEAWLMGYPRPILGRVQSVTRGISVSDAAPSTQGLPNVDAVYTWVRLAQRVPVRIRITDVPPGVPLVSGMTATISIGAPAAVKAPDGAAWARRRLDAAEAALRAFFQPPAPRPDCVPAVGDLEGRTVALPEVEPTPPRRAEQINPGLAPGLTASPRPR